MKATILSHIEISDTIYESFVQSAVLRHASKDEVIFRPGQVNKHLLFLEKGIMRAYRIIEGKEYTHHFFTDNWFATDFESYLTEHTSNLYIEALTTITYYEFDKNTLLGLFSRYPQFEKLGRIIAERAYLKMVERLVDLQTNNLQERYNNLVSRSPKLFQQVPQKFIASYLGVAEQSLSRIKSNRFPSY